MLHRFWRLVYDTFAAHVSARWNLVKASIAGQCRAFVSPFVVLTSRARHLLVTSAGI
jgi:hypothetical protein